MLRALIWVILLGALTAILAVGWFRFSAMARETETVQSLLAEGELVETIHGRIHVLRAGPEDALPILVVNGAFGWAGNWGQTIEFLADNGFRALAIDLPPFGLSERDLRTDYSRQAQALRLLAFVEQENIEPVIIAHSTSAGPALEAMLVQPERFRAAVIVSGVLATPDAPPDVPWYLSNPYISEALVASTLTNSSAQRWVYRALAFGSSSGTDEDAILEALSYPTQRQGATEAIARWLPSVMFPARGAVSDNPAALAELSTPTALIWGRDDRIAVPSRAEMLGGLLNAPMFWMDDIGHMPHLEAAPLFHEILLNALAVVVARP